MRYPQGGGLTAERQYFREELRLKAAERFARGEVSSVIAEDLRASVRSVQRWRQLWDEGGRRALRSQGPARRAIERDDEAGAGWVKEVWPCAEDSRRPVEPGWFSRMKLVSP
ncbi:helix-turn-helix domain-containing protein [Streptomyces parvus]